MKYGWSLKQVLGALLFLFLAFSSAEMYVDKTISYIGVMITVILFLASLEELYGLEFMNEKFYSKFRKLFVGMREPFYGQSNRERVSRLVAFSLHPRRATCRSK